MPDNKQPSAVQIMRTKLHRPPVDNGFIRRRCLTELLDQNPQETLTVVSAPAGYGKSALISDWVTQQDCASAWVSLDETDGDITQFLGLIVAALRDAVEESFANTTILLDGELPPVPTIAQCLANDLDEIADPYLLVLDDYHHIEPASPVHDLITRLLDHPPKGLRLILLTRRDPPLRMHALRTSGLMTEIRRRDLRFTIPETTALLGATIGATLSDEALSHLDSELEGWTAGLRLLALVLKDEPKPDAFVKKLRGGFRYLTEYLFEEVIARQDSETVEWLLNTSIVDRFCPALCMALCADSKTGEMASIEGRQFVDRLHDGDLFTIRLDASGEWQRFHHLFMQLLRDDLKQRHPDRIPKLHAIASRWFEKSGLYDEAITHALAAGDNERVGAMVKRIGPELVETEQCGHLEILLARLPTDLLESDPELLILDVWTHQFRLRMQAWEQGLERIAALLDTATLPRSELKELRACLDAMRSSYHYLASDLDQALVCSANALRSIPPRFMRLRTHATIVRGVSLQASGRIEEALSVVSSKLAEERHPTMSTQVLMLATTAVINWLSARITKMRDVSRQLERVGHDSRVVQHQRWVRQYRAIPLYHLNKLYEVVELLAEVVDKPVIQHSISVLDEASVYVLACLGLGRNDDAARIADRLLDLGWDVGADRLVDVGGALRAEVALHQGRLEHAEHWAQGYELRPLTTTYEFYLPELTHARVYVERNTRNSRKKAAELLQRVVEFAEKNNYQPVLISALALKSLLLARSDDHARAMDTLADAIEKAEPGGGLRFFLDLGTPMGDLVELLYESNGESAYLERLCNEFRQQLKNAKSYSTKPATRDQADAKLLDNLTAREMEVLELLAQRMRDKEIANELYVSPETIKTHLKHVYQKLDVSNRRQAVSRASEIGLIATDTRITS